MTAEHIHFEQKPTPEQVSRYVEKLNNYLQYLNAQAIVQIRDLPVTIKSYINGHHTSTDNHWIDGVTIKVAQQEFEIEFIPLREGIDGTETDGDIWIDAVYIQDAIYKKLGKVAQTPLPNNDPYWKLWNLYPKQQ